MGPPLTESPGWCQVNERSGTRRSPSRANTTACLPFAMEWQVLEGMAGTGASASSAGTTSAQAATRFRSARRRSPAGRRHSLFKQFHWAMTSGVTDGPIQGSGLQGQVTTATPFAPRGAGHQEGHGSRQLTSAWVLASRPCARKRRESRGLLCGIASALDAAPLPDRRRQASDARG